VIKFKQGEFTKKRINVQLASAIHQTPTIDAEAEANPEGIASHRLSIMETSE